MSSTLEVTALTRSYPDAGQRRMVLEDQTFSAGSGEVVAVTGPSGSGKSTLLNLLAGMLTPDSGTITLETDEGVVCLTDLGESARRRIRRRHIGYVFQFFNLVPTLTVRENVLLPLELNRTEHLADAALLRLSTLGLGDRLDAFPANLSGGERQRTAIARALAHQPTLVLADEPTGNLDTANARKVAALLVSEVKKLGSTLVMATHNESVAATADQSIRLGQ